MSDGPGIGRLSISWRRSLRAEPNEPVPSALSHFCLATTPKKGL